jgi:hypothetical protein
VEGVGRVAAVGTRVAQWADDVQELGDRAGPPVDEHQRGGLGLGRANMREVKGLPVNVGGELGQLVQPGLVLAPVVAVGPVGGELPQVAGRDAATPSLAAELAAPAGTGEPVS